MSNVFSRQVRKTACQVLLQQLLCTVGVTAILLLYLNYRNGMGFFFGALASIGPNFLFAYRASYYASVHQVTRFLFIFFIGALLKLLLSVLLILLIVECLQLSLLSVLIGYVSAIIFFSMAGMHAFKQSP